VQSVIGNTVLDVVAIIGTALLAETIEQVGRLRAQVIGFAGSVIGLLLVWVFALHGPPPLAVLIAGLTLWQVAISYGPSNTCWVFPVELYPTDLRASAHGLATAVSRAGALVAVFLLPLVQAVIGVTWLMLAFAVIGVLGAVLSAWLGEETAGKPLLQEAVAGAAKLVTAPARPEVESIRSLTQLGSLCFDSVTHWRGIATKLMLPAPVLPRHTNSNVKEPRHAPASLGFAVPLLFLAIAAQAAGFDPGLYANLHWRLIGPFRSGRVLAVSGVPGRPNHFYFGSVDGGVWQTSDAGRTWNPILTRNPSGPSARSRWRPPIQK